MQKSYKPRNGRGRQEDRGRGPMPVGRGRNKGRNLGNPFEREHSRDQTGDQKGRQSSGRGFDAEGAGPRRSVERLPSGTRGGPRGRHERGRETAGGEGRAADAATVRYSALLMRKARAAHPDSVGPTASPEPLAGLDYAQELELKNSALQEFWQAHGLPDKPNRVHPSPKPRHYRLTTKRRVINTRGRYQLDFHPEKAVGAKAMGAASELEPAEHQAIYAFILDKLNQDAYGALAHSLNYVIIRGDYRRFSVFFNVHRLNAGIVRKAKLLGDHLQKLKFGGKESQGEETPKVLSGFVFFDPGRSQFYLDQRANEGPWKLKRLFGPEQLRMRVGERDYVFGPTSFSQVNGSILPDFLEKAEQLLKPKSHQRLLDLYCGFGFFSLKLAPGYADALGVEASTDSIESAKEMSRALKIRCRFRQGKIQPKGLDALLPKADGTPESILLDPPRQGADPGVIRALAARAPVRVLHIFCDMDVLPREINAWRKSGYMVSKVVPLDMFPGTDNLEVMVLFIPDRYGILNRVTRKEDIADFPEP